MALPNPDTVTISDFSLESSVAVKYRNGMNLKESILACGKEKNPPGRSIECKKCPLWHFCKANLNCVRRVLNNGERMIATVVKSTWQEKSPNFIHGSYESVLPVDYSGQVYQLTDTSGKLRTVDRRKPKSEIDFCLLSDGRLIFGVNHSALANGRSVRYAGTLNVSPGPGVVSSWNNNSGHYVPHPDDREGISLAKRALESTFSNMDFSNFQPVSN